MKFRRIPWSVSWGAAADLVKDHIPPLVLLGSIAL